MYFHLFALTSCKKALEKLDAKYYTAEFFRAISTRLAKPHSETFEALSVYCLALIYCRHFVSLEILGGSCNFMILLKTLTQIHRVGREAQISINFLQADLFPVLQFFESIIIENNSIDTLSIVFKGCHHWLHHECDLSECINQYMKLLNSITIRLLIRD